MKAYLAAAAALSLCALGAPASADVVTYQISASGTGSLAGTPFSGPFTILLTGDNANLSSCDVTCEFLSPLTSTVVTIPGVGSVTLTGATDLGITRSNDVFFLGQPGTSDLFDFFVTDAQQAAFTFQSSYGPVSSSSLFAVGQFKNIASTGGLLTLTPSGTITFQSVVGGVPEPGSWAMMLLGFAGMGLVFRRKATGTPASAAV